MEKDKVVSDVKEYLGTHLPTGFVGALLALLIVELLKWLGERKQHG